MSYTTDINLNNNQDDDHDLVKKYRLQKQYEETVKLLNEGVQPFGVLLQMHCNLFGVYMLQNDLESMHYMVIALQQVHQVSQVLIAAMLDGIPSLSPHQQRSSILDTLSAQEEKGKKTEKSDNKEKSEKRGQQTPMTPINTLYQQQIQDILKGMQWQSPEEEQEP